MPVEVIERAMTFYDEAAYQSPLAIKHKKTWNNDRIDFQPWPYPSATKLITKALSETVVAGDKGFLAKLDPDFVAQDLVDYTFVRNALERFPDWKKDPSVNPADPFNRTEVIEL